jgi:hypothetical protein
MHYQQNKFCTPIKPQNKFCTPIKPQNKFCTPSGLQDLNLKRHGVVKSDFTASVLEHL